MYLSNVNTTFTFNTFQNKYKKSGCFHDNKENLKKNIECGIRGKSILNKKHRNIRFGDKAIILVLCHIDIYIYLKDVDTW